MIGLIRGINVGGKTLPMANLRAICERIRLKDAQTYIQSGNIFFESGKSNSDIERALENGIEKDFGYTVTAMVREPELFEHLIDSNPFEGRDPKFLSVTILGQSPKAELVATLDSVDHGEDEFRVEKDAIYIYCPGGYGNTRLTNNFIESKLQTRATTRNWRTFNKLLEIAKKR